MWPFKKKVQDVQQYTITKAVKDAINALTGKFTALKAMISGLLPGMWQSDHQTESKQYVGWVYVAVRSIATQFQQATAVVLKPVASIGKVQKSHTDILSGGDATETEPVGPLHPVQMLLDKPNPEQSGADFMSQRAIQIKLTGSCFVWNIWKDDSKTEVAERYVLPTALLQPQPFSVEYPCGYYRLVPVGQMSSIVPFATDGGFDPKWGTNFVQRALLTGQPIDMRDLQVSREPHAFAFGDGYGPVAAAARWIDGAQAVDESRYAHVQQGPRPGLLIRPDPDGNPDEDDIEVLKSDIKDRHGDPTAHGRSLFIPRGLEVTPWAKEAGSVGYDTSFLQYRDAILSVFGVPPIGAGITEAGSYTAYYAAQVGWIELRIQPDLDFFGREDSQFFSRRYDENIIISYRAKRPNDPQMVENRVKTIIQGRLATVNEVRLMLDMPPTAEVWGDERAGETKTSIKENEVDPKPTPK